MELADLDQNERLALVALLKATALADGVVSPDEEEALGAIVDAFGEEAYQATFAEADRRFRDEAALRAFLETAGRPEARDVIYGTVLEVALADSVAGGESDLLGWLGERWGIEVAGGELDDERPLA